MTDRDDPMIRYYAALHRVQTGVAYEMEWTEQTSPKHLRVGVNSALVDSVAVAHLLLAKGVISQDEYEEQLAVEMEREAADYEQRVQEHFDDPNIRLA